MSTKKLLPLVLLVLMIAACSKPKETIVKSTLYVENTTFYNVGVEFYHIDLVYNDTIILGYDVYPLEKIKFFTLYSLNSGFWNSYEYPNSYDYVKIHLFDTVIKQTARTGFLNFDAYKLIDDSTYTKNDTLFNYRLLTVDDEFIKSIKGE